MKLPGIFNHREEKELVCCGFGGYFFVCMVWGFVIVVVLAFIIVLV